MHQPQSNRRPTQNSTAKCWNFMQTPKMLCFYCSPKICSLNGSQSTESRRFKEEFPQPTTLSDGQRLPSHGDVHTYSQQSEQYSTSCNTPCQGRNGQRFSQTTWLAEWHTLLTPCMPRVPDMIGHLPNWLARGRRGGCAGSLPVPDATIQVLAREVPCPCGWL